MAPRHQTLPPAATSSAREALQSFYCQLCQKGYSRMNEYEAHLSSYDHSHRQRMKDMKAMVRDPNATARARRQEAKDVGVVSIKLGEGAAGAAGAASGASSGSAAAGGGFKKGGFKKTGFKAAFASAGQAEKEAADQLEQTSTTVPDGKAPTSKDEFEESDTGDEGYEMYDPRNPTD